MIPGLFDQQAIMMAYPQSGPELAQSIVRVGRNLRTNPRWLANVINWESGMAFSTSARNKSSGATGLIQFMPKVAKVLGTTTAKLAKMDAREQMAYVQYYFEKVASGSYRDPYTQTKYEPGPLHTKQAVYMTIFYPAYRYVPLDTRFPANVRKANNVETVRAYIAKVDSVAKL